MKNREYEKIIGSCELMNSEEILSKCNYSYDDNWDVWFNMKLKHIITNVCVENYKRQKVANLIAERVIDNNKEDWKIDWFIYPRDSGQEIMEREMALVKIKSYFQGKLSIDGVDFPLETNKPKEH